MSYATDHPTHFDWRPDVARMVRELQGKFPWKTYVCTYWWHPPYHWPEITIRYDARSLDVWDGGGTGPGNYSGYRGKPLPRELGKKVFRFLWFYEGKPDIYWIIYMGRMWVNLKYGGRGWGPAPPGPPDSDPDHKLHLHVTYV